jgi:alanine-synthesizing transaminase
VTERTRGVVVVHPNNPTGSYVKAAEARILNSFCREHGLAVIVDEVFLDYELETSGAKAPAQEEHNRSAESASPPKSDTAPESDARRKIAAAPKSDLPPKNSAPPQIGQGNGRHASFAVNRDVLTFTLSGLSKVLALPQMKVAWLVTSGPQGLTAAAMGRLEVIADTYLSMNAPVQWALPALLKQRADIQRQLLERVKANLAELDRQLAGQKACQRLDVEGGWYAVLRVPVTRTDEELAIELLREKAVVVHPGHFFDFPSDGYLVLSLIAPVGEFAVGIAAILEKLYS